MQLVRSPYQILKYPKWSIWKSRDGHERKRVVS
jgi:hypothetical protein